MAITSKDEMSAAIFGAQPCSIVKTAARTTVANRWFSLLDVAGNPGAGVIAGTSVAAGVVPTDATDGMPNIPAFAVGAGFLSGVQWGASATCRLRLCDLLWKGGAYPFNAAQALAAQPSYASRIPLIGATPNYDGVGIWYEQVTASTGNPTITVTYTNDQGVAGRTTGAIALGVAPTVGSMFQLPLQAGDRGVQKIESVTSTVASAGTFNILVIRYLWSGRVEIANAGDAHGPAKTQCVRVFTDSALFLMANCDGVSSGIIDTTFFIANG